MKAFVERENPSKAAASPDKDGFKVQQPGIASLFPPSFNLTTTPPSSDPPNTHAQMGVLAFPIPALQLTNGAKSIPLNVQGVSNPQSLIPGVMNTPAKPPLLDDEKSKAAIEYLRDREAGRKFKGVKGIQLWSYYSNYGFLQAEKLFFEKHFPIMGNPMELPYGQRVEKIAEFQEGKKAVDGRLDEDTFKLAGISYSLSDGMKNGPKRRVNELAVAIVTTPGKHEKYLEYYERDKNEELLAAASRKGQRNRIWGLFLKEWGKGKGVGRSPENLIGDLRRDQWGGAIGHFRSILVKELSKFASKNDEDFLKEGRRWANSNDGFIIEAERFLPGEIKKISDRIKEHLAPMGSKARIKELSFFTHGGKSYLVVGNWHSVSEIFSGINEYLTQDVNVNFYACQTADKADKKQGFAYETAAFLVDSGKKKAKVWGNKYVGHTTRNPAKMMISHQGEELIYKVTDYQAFVRDSADLDKFKLEGKRRVKIPRGTEVIVDKRTEDNKFVHAVDAKNSSQIYGWTANSNLTIQLDVKSRKQVFLDSINKNVIKQIVKRGGYSINTEGDKLSKLVGLVKGILSQKDAEYFIVKHSGFANSPLGYQLTTHREDVVKTVLAQFFEEKKAELERKFPRPT